MKTIVTPTDFSSSSINAVHYAADLAVSLGAELILLNVVQLPITVSDVPMTESVFEELIDSAREEMDDLEKELASRTAGKIKITKELVAGTVENQLEEICHAKNPFAVVMGMKEGADAGRFLLGSNALYAVKHLRFPVLVVPEHSTFRGIRHMGLACDLQDVAKSIPFSLMEEWLEAFKARLDIIHVCNSADAKELQNGKDALYVRERFSNFQPQLHFLPKQQVEKGLDEFSRQHQVDLLMVVPKKHDIWEWFDRKHSKGIILHTHIPVLSMR
ncbi:MAG TPA: universal stress protein [Puia sp.]|nr:universal stress protein [Puia sp.]